MRTAVLQRSLLLVVLAALAACGGGGGGNNDGGTGAPPTGTPAPAPAPSPAPAPAPSPSPTPTPTPTGDFFARAAALYAEPPNIAACQPGRLLPEVTARVLNTLNEIRRLHRLPTVGYATAEEAAEMQSSLVIAANEQLTHEPPASSRCYTPAAANAARTSNLYGGWSPFLGFEPEEAIVTGWLTDVRNAIPDNIGHRRWLLDPFLGNIAYGRVAGASATSGRVDAGALKVIGTTGSTASAANLPPFVAYPYEDYPARYFADGALLSFGVIASATNRNANANVNFAQATITVRERGGATLNVSNVSFDNQGFGLPNSLQFAVAGLRPAVTYDVSIANVVVGGTPTNYSYYFRIVP